jgi:hypothetical protein
MPSGSSTVATLAVQMARLADEQKELRSLVLDVLKEMLQTSQLQAQANADFVVLIREEREVLRAFQNVGPGSTRDRTEQDEFDEMKAEIIRREQGL